MRRLVIVTLLISLIISGLKAQNSETVTIKGTVYDNTLQETIPSASIRVLSPRDSSYIAGAVTNKDGYFNITVPNKRYIVEASFIGFNSRYFNVNASKNGDLGKIYLSENSIMLGEAIVTAKAVDIMVKGDTVEYNADSYKVQESAVLEDLVKKIPGAEVDSDGKITVNGKEISKILVDGKEFFTDDPKVASKNLPAKMIEKLQVLDRKSDMAQLTGFDDGDEETVLNLTVKKGMKEGMFGNFLGGYGSRGRYEGNGILNYMRNNTQLTVVGGLNNTNNAGFTDFASNIGQGGPPRGRVNFGGNSGIATTNNIGINFATEIEKKLKINGDIRYGKIDNDVVSEKDRNYGLNQIKEREYSKSSGNNISENFGANLRFEWTPDTLTKIIFRPQFQYNKNENNQISNGFTNYSDGLSSLEYTLDSMRYNSNSDGWSAKGDLMISRKISKNGRSLTMRISGELGDNNSEAYSYSNNIYHFRNSTKLDSIPKAIDQYSKQYSPNRNWRASIAYIEPLGRSNFLELEYTVRNNYSDMDKKVYSNDNNDNYGMLVDSVTRRIENDFIRQNITLSFQSMRRNFNYTIGMGLEPTKTETTITDPILGKRKGKSINTAFFAPRARFNYVWSKRKTLRLDYWGSATQPSTQQLFDGIYSNSGNSIVRGNTGLKPSYENKVGLRFQNFNPDKASTLMVFARFSQTMNAIVGTRYTEMTTGVPIEVSSYKNTNGNMSANARLIYNTPINKKRNLSANSMTFVNYDRSNSFISNNSASDLLRNRAENYQITESAGIRFTSDVFDFSTRANFSLKQVKNSIADNNQKVYDFGGLADFTVYLPFNFQISSDMSYSGNSGYGSDFNRKEWLWNASISKDFLKTKNATLRIKMYDILQQRSNISWSASDGYTQSIRTNTINSYVMVNFVYRFQVFKGGAKMSDVRGNDPRRGPGGFGGQRRF